MAKKSYTLEELPWEQRDGRKFAQLKLKRGESAPNPVSTTKPLIYGPATLEYTWWNDGGLDLHVVDYD